VIRAPFRLVAAAALLAIFAGCKVGPNYTRPSVPVAPTWKEQAPWRIASPQDTIPKGSWWTIFHDEELNQYEAQAIKANQTLEAARNQLEQARATVRITQSGLFPQLAAGVTAQRSRSSANQPTASGVPLSAPVTQNGFVVPFNASWEADVFGGLRRSVESSNAAYQSSAAALENVRLLITSDLAADYFNLRELDAEIAVVDSAVQYQGKALDLVNNRHAGGVASGLDVAQQETQLNATRTQATLLRNQRAQFEHAIAALTGVSASSFSIPVKPLAIALPAFPVGLPSDVLERRPDVAQAERLMAAQNAQIGVAKSAFFPSIGITGGAGFNSHDITTLANAPSVFWALGANVAETVLSGGRRKAQMDFASSAYGASVANYRQSVLTAFQEVEDGLSGLSILAQAADTQNQAVDAAQRALKIANDRYVGGLVTYLDVVTAEQTLLDNQRLAAQLLGQRLVTSVSLIKALGGGWDASSLQSLPLNTNWKQTVQP